jgi:hypothetical protein
MRHSLKPAAIGSIVLLLGVVTDNATGQGANAEVLLVPHESWTCGLPAGIPDPDNASLIFQAELKLDRVIDVGRTQYGRRQVGVVQEGTVTGPKVTGSVMTGALDFQLTLDNGVIEIEQIFVLRTSDSRYVYVRAAGTGTDAKDVRVVMDFEAPTEGDVAWLNSGTYVARRVLDAGARTLTLHVYDVSGARPPADGRRAVRITKPAGVPPQPWDYRTAGPTEKRGAQLIVETVALSPSQTVGASKRGPRNIIPITGGELTGRITGKVLPGGADYQNLSPPATIDARYLWQTADGEVIIVRNGGSFGSLVPTFEVRVDSPYAFLNNGVYLSSNPEKRQGGVGLTFYESMQ